MADSNATVLESQLEYLSLSKPKKILYRFTHFFTNMPKRFKAKARSMKIKARKSKKGFLGVFAHLFDAIRNGDYKTRLSFLIMGFGLFTRRQAIRGIFYFLFEIAFIAFLAAIGVPSLSHLSNLGAVAGGSYPSTSGILDIMVPVYYDNSFTILLYSLLTIAFILLFIFLYYNQIRDSKELQDKETIGRYASDRQTVKNVFEKSYNKTLLFIPIGSLMLFTVFPIIMMVVIAFTNYDYMHEPNAKLFDWVGFYNLETIFSSNSSSTSSPVFLQTFLKVLLWTLVWAFFATFSNYFLGMIVAMIINTKGIKLKKLWRTILITTIAVPQFVSLLLVSQMFADSGIVNNILQNMGWIKGPIHWLTDPVLAKVTIILVNTWVGIPYTMLICTGLLMNIPEDLYESARIDGASPAKMYFKITLPYMLFVTGPYLISQFVGNINNFNVIYLLSGGGPIFTFTTSNVPGIIRDSRVGNTDLLITWIYKITTNSSYDYGMASVLGIIIFAVVAFFSMIFYNRSGSVKDEEAFQ